MSSLDDLIAAKLTPTTAPAGPAQGGDLDAAIAARLAGAPAPAAAPAGPASAASAPSLMDFITSPIQSAARSPDVAAAGSAFRHHLANLPHGIAQLAENGAAALFNLAPDNPVSRYVSGVAASDNRAMNDREVAYQRATPDGIPATVGATAGEIAPMFVGGVAKGLAGIGDYVGAKAASLLPSAAQKVGAKLASAATQGATVSAAKPVAAPPSITDLVTGTQAPDYWKSKAAATALGAALGGAVPAAATGVGAAVRGVKNAAAPVLAPATVVAPNLERLLTRDGQLPLGDVIDQLRAPATLVEGSKPTTAQVLAHPDAVMAEKTVSNTPAGKAVFEDLANANNAARVAALQKIAGSPEALEAAITARGDATQPMIEKLLKDPKTSQPVRAATILSKVNELENSSFSTDPVIKKTLGAIRTQINDAAAKTDVNAYTYTPPQLRALKDEPYVRPDLLDGIRQNLRNTISDNASNGAVSSKQEAGLQPLADHITSAIDGANKGYRDYLATYAKTSQPINAMEAAGRVLGDVAGPGRGLNSAGDAQATLAGYRTALAKALKSSPYGLEPSAQAALDAIQSDLQRASISGSVKSAGSDTAFNLQAPGWLAGKLYGENMTGGGKGVKALASALGAAGGSVIPHVGTAAGAFAGWKGASTVADMGASKVNAMLARALAEPEYAVELLQQAQQAKTALPPPGVSARIPQMNLLLGQTLGQRTP